MNLAKVNLHTHTYHSDGIYSPSHLVHSAKRLGVTVISITDHNEIRGTLVGFKVANRLGLIFFPGIELMFMVKGRVYELLAYFSEVEEIKSFYDEYRFGNGFMPNFKSVPEVVSLIRKYNGAVVVPHPFGRKGIFRKHRNRGMNVDAIEDVNAFTGEKRNDKAKDHTDHDNDFLRFGAADMHFFVSDMAKVYTKAESSNQISKDLFWQNLIGNDRSIKFTPIGENFSAKKIFFQKPLCTFVYFVNYPRLYLSYWLGKRSHKKLNHNI